MERSICEGCKLERFLDKQDNRVCIPKTAFRKDLRPERITQGKTCDNKEAYEALTSTDMADAANYPLG